MIKSFIRQAYENPYLPLHTEPLRILVVGGDAEINSVCNILGNIYDGIERFEPKNNAGKKFKPHMLKNLDIRVYIIPSRDCALAQFLAVKDPWYFRSKTSRTLCIKYDYFVCFYCISTLMFDLKWNIKWVGFKSDHLSMA